MEKVIKDTESLFKTREKEYQETIDQIEVRMRVEGPRGCGRGCRSRGPILRTPDARPPLPLWGGVSAQLLYLWWVKTSGGRQTDGFKSQLSHLLLL